MLHGISKYMLFVSMKVLQMNKLNFPKTIRLSFPKNIFIAKKYMLQHKNSESLFSHNHKKITKIKIKIVYCEPINTLTNIAGDERTTQTRNHFSLIFNFTQQNQNQKKTKSFGVITLHRPQVLLEIKVYLVVQSESYSSDHLGKVSHE